MGAISSAKWSQIVANGGSVTSYWRDNYLNKWTDPAPWRDTTATSNQWQITYPGYPDQVLPETRPAIDWDKLNAEYQRRLLERTITDLQPQSPLPPMDMKPKQKPEPRPKKPTIEPAPSTGTRRFFLDD